MEKSIQSTINLIDNSFNQIVNLKSRCLNEVIATFESVRSTLIKFAEDCPNSDSFNLFKNSLDISITKLFSLIDEMRSIEEFDKWELNKKIEIFELDFLINSKINQIIYIFNINKKSPIKLIWDDDAKIFWTNNFINKTAVPNEDFIKKFYTGDKQEIILKFLDHTEDSFISLYDFEIFLLLFGPFKDCIHNFFETYNANVLSGFITSYRAEMILYKKPPGSFLVRFSKTKPGCFVISLCVKNDSNKAIMNEFILYSIRPNGLTPKNPPIYYSSLMEFIRAYKHQLKFPIIN